LDDGDAAHEYRCGESANVTDYSTAKGYDDGSAIASLSHHRRGQFLDGRKLLGTLSVGHGNDLDGAVSPA
jgi:hypothetical protein